MAPRHTRIVALLLLLAIYAVGVLSAGDSSSSSSGGGGVRWPGRRLLSTLGLRSSVSGGVRWPRKGLFSGLNLRSSGSDKVPEVPGVRKDMRAEAEFDQLASPNDHIFFRDRSLDLGHDSRFDDRALEHAREHGAKFVGIEGPHLYFYSIIQPDQELGKAIRIRKNIGDYGYVRAIWEHDKDRKTSSIIALIGDDTMAIVRKPTINWKMDPLKEVLNHIPK